MKRSILAVFTLPGAKPPFTRGLKHTRKDALSNLWVVIANAIPPLGFVMYLKYKQHYPNKAESALICALAGVPIALKAGCFLNTYILN